MHALPALGRSAYERAGGSEIPGRSCSLQTGSLISSAHDSHRRFERLSANLLHYFVPGTLVSLARSNATNSGCTLCRLSADQRTREPEGQKSQGNRALSKQARLYLVLMTVTGDLKGSRPICCITSCQGH